MSTLTITKSAAEVRWKILRTQVMLYQSLLPFHLLNPQYCSLSTVHTNCLPILNIHSDSQYQSTIQLSKNELSSHSTSCPHATVRAQRHRPPHSRSVFCNRCSRDVRYTHATYHRQLLSELGAPPPDATQRDDGPSTGGERRISPERGACSGEIVCDRKWGVTRVGCWNEYRQPV